MKRFLPFAFLTWLLLIAAGVPALAGDLIDGVVATVNRKPILRSDWDEAVDFEAFMQQKPLSQVSDADRAMALQRLIDRQLLRAQMVDAGYMQPSPRELSQDVAKLRAQVPNGKDDESWHKVLASYDLTEDMVKEHLRTEFQVMNFVEVRLRPNVHVQEEDVVAYYHNQLLPDLEKTGGKVVPLDQVGPRIRELLTQQRMDELLDAWMHNLRQQAEIHSTVAIPGISSSTGTRASGIN